MTSSNGAKNSEPVAPIGVPLSGPFGIVALLEESRGWDIVAFLGLLTFVTTIAYECGIASCWDIPIEFVSFSAENALGIFLGIKATNQPQGPITACLGLVDTRV